MLHDMLANAQIAFLQHINPDLKRVTRTGFCPHIGAYSTDVDLVQYTHAIGMHETLLYPLQKPLPDLLTHVSVTVCRFASAI